MRPIVALDARLITSSNTGDSSYWRGLVGGLIELDPDIQFLLYSNAPRPDWIPENEKFSWKVVEPSSSRQWSWFDFPEAALEAGAKAVHTQYSLSPLLKDVGITTIHDVSFMIGPRWFGLKDLFILRTQIPATVKRAQKIITVSETSRSEIETFLPAAIGKTEVTYNALGKNIAPMPKEKAEAMVRELGITEPYLFTVGTRWPRKNMALAVEAVKHLPDEVTNRLVVTGKPGWGKEDFHDRVTATGYVSDEQLTALYQCAEMYLAPSRHEGFGIPLLEAWACETPVVCSMGGALPEVADDAAEVVESWQAQDWADAISNLLQDSSKLERLREAGRKRLNDFSWRDTAQKTVEIYREVIG